MAKTTKPDQPKSPGRRDALRRLAGFVTAAYVVPEVLILSEARAASAVSTAQSSSTAPSTSESTSAPSSSTSTSSSPSSTSSTSGPSASEHAPGDSCHISGPSGANTLSISRSDMRRAQESVEAGYAQPLESIWGKFKGNYDGKVIGIEFTGAQQNPQYRFRAISRAGRLETVTISAQTGDILRIVGC